MAKRITPRWRIEQAISAGKEALLLLQGREEELLPRLSAGLPDSLKADVAELESLLTGRPAKITEVKGMTGTEMEISEKGATWVSAIREAVRRRSGDAGLEKAVGVGDKVLKANSKSVVAAIQAILTAAKDKPDEIRNCGILEADLKKGEEILKSLVGVRDVQEEGIKSKKDLTTKKNIIQIRIEKMVMEISSAGYLEYLDKDPVLANRFRDLVPSKSSKTQKGEEEPKPQEPPKA